MTSMVFHLQKICIAVSILLESYILYNIFNQTSNKILSRYYFTIFAKHLAQMFDFRLFCTKNIEIFCVDCASGWVYTLLRICFGLDNRQAIRSWFKSF